MDWPITPPLDAPAIFLSNAELWLERVGVQPDLVSAIWPVANDAILCPIFVPRPMTVKKLYAFNGGTASGNCDIALSATAYTRVAGGKAMVRPAGSFLTQAGSTAQAGTSAWQTFNVTDVRIAAGIYWLSYALGNTTGRVTTLGTLPGLAAQFIYGAFWHVAAGVPMAVPSSSSAIADWLANDGKLVPLLGLGGVA